MTPEFELFLQVVIETLTLLALIVGLLGLIVPVFPGLVIMWLGTLLYALIQNAAGNMTNLKCYYPEDERFLIEQDDRVRHYEIVAGA